MSDPKCSISEALDRARRMVGQGGRYILGTGDYRPEVKDGKILRDLPWTRGHQAGSWYGVEGSDCAGFAICWVWKLRRHRPGFNVGPWASVSEDINCNSALEDGLHKQELFVTLPEGENIQPTDLVVYPTIRIKVGGKIKVFVGHAGVIETVPVGFRYGDWSKLGVIQCHGPNGRAPGVVRTDGTVWDQHDELWGKPEHRTRVIRPIERL